jgi:imidazoleglycerol-phosphate dehydratase
MISRKRETKETDISVELELYGSGKSSINTGVGFFDHMLEAFSKHALIDLNVVCQGDTHIDDHHSVEDVGIVIGQALAEAIYPIEKVERFGNASVVMDETCVECDMDLSGRPYLHYDVDVNGKVGSFDTELAEEFFHALVLNARISTHLVLKRGRNKHHILEASFKAFAVALRRATAKNERTGIPSTKGVL